MPQQPHRAGMGSGFIVSPDGSILTNAHVVQNASEVTVKLTDRREFKAKVIGIDPQTDVAVLKIDAQEPADREARQGERHARRRMGRRDRLAFGFENTVTSGIVSAKSRSLPDGAYVPFIQTDVAVNPGNSGGPLFNLKGEVVGINSQIYSRSRRLPRAVVRDSDRTALHVKDQLVQHGKVTRGRLGVTIQEVNQSLANSFGLDKRAARWSSVEDGSPAAKAGVKPGDVMLKMDGAEIGSSLDLSSRVATMKPGTKAKLEVWRDGKPREIAVAVGEAPSQQTATARQSRSLGRAARRGGAGPDPRRAATGQSAKAGWWSSRSPGAAAKAGIRAGDIILSVNGKPVKSVEDLRAATKDAQKTMALLVQRNDARIFVPVSWADDVS